LNRHRIGYHAFFAFDDDMPIHPWYIKHLNYYGIQIEEKYALPMPHYLLGKQAAILYGMPNDQAIYFVKLRSRPSVHPTLRMAVNEFASNVTYSQYLDTTPDPGLDGYILSRGKDTITIRGS
jgi:hypothetical protein